MRFVISESSRSATSRYADLLRGALKAAPIVLALVLGSGTAAMAADFGIHIPTLSNTVTLKAFSVPARGTCRDYRGFYINGPFWVRGTACGSSDDTNITFFQNWFSESGSIVGTDKFSLSRTGLTGTGSGCVIDTGSGSICSTNTYEHVACTLAVVPIPE